MISEQTEIGASKNRTNTNPSLKLHPGLPLTTATDAPARSLTCGKQAPQLSNWHESHESEMRFLWKHGARGLGVGGTWKRGADHRRPMKLRSGKRREERVGGGRIAQVAVEVLMARATPGGRGRSEDCSVRPWLRLCPYPGSRRLQRSGTQTPAGTCDFSLFSYGPAIVGPNRFNCGTRV